MALESMQNQFSGLPMESLIGSPLKAACDSQIMLARSTVDFIQNVGFDGAKTRTADFSYERNVVTGKDGLDNDIIEQEKVGLEVPVLAIVNVPSLMVDEVDITFDMEVKSSETYHETEDKKGEFSAKASVGWGPFSLTASVSGSVASHKENTRSSDNSAKYHVAVHASQSGTPEGLMRVLDIIGGSVAPKSIERSGKVKASGQRAIAVAQARKKVAKAKADLTLQQMKLEQSKLKNPKSDTSELEKKVNESNIAVVDAEIELQQANMALQDEKDANTKESKSAA
ncbi:DUF2589 domain-containing protein [Aliivibrio fischeri]|uniref:DUF2589 domain-containing protein n=1 Tax=Aliivibrio fischeri TaxID=668 RepID=A0A844NYT5_ALIFS|nr:DUF2589 domain-containing protein [Aliivibrio fischeri]MUK29119.1 DUF2589 domain-containing protein [Aliivibrio fischeri]MUK48255.1 DUF2589 domain-containing protein [Aliivibrio fischeri]MUK64204.1 DUF2589 domain-containing protein [Aliivibrio fischeri]